MGKVWVVLRQPKQMEKAVRSTGTHALTLVRQGL